MIEGTLRRLGASDDVKEMLAEFLAYHEANIARESQPFPGAVAVFERLAAEGATLAICTNKPERLSLLLQELEIEDYFSMIAGRDTFPMSKPNPGHLTRTITLAGGDPSNALTIGDSDVDVMTAKAAQVPIILVSFGYATTPLAGLKAEATIDHFDQLDVCAANTARYR
jgi:phosphoglycolate phosphatase